MDIQFGNLTSLNLLWIVGGLLGLLLLAAAWRRRDLACFATANLVQRLTAGLSGPRRVVKQMLLIGALVLLTVALTDPRWGQSWREVPQRGIDVMFAVDVSRSMLAEDATPSRLERARQQIGDMLEAMHGDRVGLIAFAGDARQVSPLTTNYHDFKQTLATIGPHSVLRGGSRLGDALQLAARGFLDQTDDHKAIVVFSDGEDQESQPAEVARTLHNEQGIRIFTVGLGDPEQGARIPVARTRQQTEWLRHAGEQVWSKMNGTILEQVAQASDGAWIPAGTRQVDMADVYHTCVAGIEQTQFATARIHSHIPRHQWFVGLALLLLLIEIWLSDRRRTPSSPPHRARPARETEKHRQRHRRGSLVVPLIALCLFNLGAARPGSAEDGRSLVASANEAVAAGEYAAAIDQYRRAGQQRPDRWEPVYNEAVAQYRLGELQTARQLFTQALAAPDRALESKARFNLANCDYAEGVASAEQDPEAAIARLQSAISHYRGALEADAADGDARINIELASRLIEQLEQQQQEKQQSQDQQQSDDSQSAQSQDAQQQPSTDVQQSAEPDNQQSSESESQENKPSESQSADSPSSVVEESAKDTSDEPHDERDSQTGDWDEPSETSDQQPSASESEPAQTREDAQQPEDHARQSQSPSSSESPLDSQPQDAEQDSNERPDAAELSSDVSQAPSDQHSSGASQYGHAWAESASEDAQPMTQIEAEKMLQSVRDRELRRRLERLQTERQRYVPVDRDW